MKIRFTIIIASILFLSSSILAQDKEAENILKELSEKTNSFDNIKVSFAYKMTNQEANINESTNGTLLVAGDKYRLNIAGQEIISDGSTLWTYLEDSEEVQINEVIENEGFSPTKLLSSYHDEYTMKKDKNIVKEGKSYYELTMKPKDSNSNFDFVILLVDAEKMQLNSFVMYDFDDNIFSYEIKQFITDSDIPESSFTFNTENYPNIEVIDMR